MWGLTFLLPPPPHHPIPNLPISYQKRPMVYIHVMKECCKPPLQIFLVHFAAEVNAFGDMNFNDCCRVNNVLYRCQI